MDVRLRAFQDRDFEFVRELYFETMRWAIERYFGWNRLQQEENFSTWFKPNEARIITADGTDAGWIQQRHDASEIFLGSIYVTPAMQGKGIGTSVIQDLLHLAEHRSQAVTLAVMKINPAVRLYQRLGFHPTHEDDYKVYMRADPKAGGSCPTDSMQRS
ncbi:MAG TPA: GNAT family N-acetyltransferase [Bryobacteraceae bacterium]|jgi:GNAT superfamily N-acetyltransferase|nr:GNAT family N-acetyltransferase [Bryobacteraceae bacterium]